jgi:hypothetical protein
LLESSRGGEFRDGCERGHPLAAGSGPDERGKPVPVYGRVFVSLGARQPFDAA